jgi:protocatechuate 3,4-dioxygenase beta subunit
MSRVLLTFLAANFLSVVSAAQAPSSPQGFSQPPRDTSAQTGTAIIRGHVVDASNGQPIRKAQVRALSPELRDNRLAVTDQSGAYEFKNLAAGRYTLSASKGSYVAVSYGQMRPLEPGRPLDVRNAQLVDNVDFRLPRGAVITGRVVDEFGEPIEEVQVMAMRFQYSQGRRQLATSRSGMTNDIGEFRIYGLQPGQYVISATYRAANFTFPGDPSSADRDRDRSGYAPTYYPGTANSTDAQRLNVSVGQKISDVTIALLPTRLARISGIVVDSEGRPLANAMVMTTQPSTGGMLSAGGQLRADGTFTIGNVAPGDYTLVVLPRSAPNAPGAEPSNESVQANVSVNGEDLDDVRLVGVKPSKLRGRVIPDASQTNVSLASLQLVATPDNPRPLGGTSGTGRVNEDGTFELSVAPGKSFIRMSVGGQFANTRLKAVRLNGVDVIDTGIEFRPNENIDGVEIELTTQLSSVSGGVTDARGNAVSSYMVITFARDREKWGPGSRYMNSARPNQDGRYKINLPQGDYYAIALDYVEQGANTDPEFLDRLKDRATEFSINEAETKSLDLKLVTGM